MKNKDIDIDIDLKLNNLQANDKTYEVVGKSNSIYINFRIGKSVADEFKSLTQRKDVMQRGIVHFNQLFMYLVDLVEEEYLRKYKVLKKPKTYDMMFYTKNTFGKHYIPKEHNNIVSMKFPVPENYYDKFHSLMHTFYSNEKDIRELYSVRFGLSFYFYFFMKEAIMIINKN